MDVKEIMKRIGITEEELKDLGVKDGFNIISTINNLTLLTNYYLYYNHNMIIIMILYIYIIYNCIIV